MKSQVRSPTSALFPACKVFSLHLPQQARRMSDQREKERRMHCLSTIKTIEVMAKLNDPTKVIYSRHSGQIIPKFESMLNQNTIVISQDEPYTQLKQSNEPKPKFPNYILAAMKPVLFSSLLFSSQSMTIYPIKIHQRIRSKKLPTPTFKIQATQIDNPCEETSYNLSEKRSKNTLLKTKDTSNFQHQKDTNFTKPSNSEIPHPNHKQSFTSEYKKWVSMTGC